MILLQSLVRDVDMYEETKSKMRSKFGKRLGDASSNKMSCRGQRI
jgi:hypothetical protein